MQKNNPVISIITPVFNRAHIIRSSIDSVLSQTFLNWELLLVDDGSTDNIEEFVSDNYATDTRIKLIKRNSLPKGASTCRNIGIDQAIGQFIIFLDSDDLLESFCLEQRFKAMAENINLDFGVFRFKYRNNEGKYIENSFVNGKDPLINFLSNKSYWNITCPVWKKSFLLSLGGFNTDFKRYQDVEMHIRALTQPEVNYKLFDEYEPDMIVIPSAKDQTGFFAFNVFDSLMLLIPQTIECLNRLNKSEYIQFMEGFLKEWMRLLLRSNFESGVYKKTIEVLGVFKKNKIIPKDKMWFYQSGLIGFNFLIRLILNLYSKLI